MDAENMGLLISEQRKELKMTQKELAEKIGVTDKAISKWERGKGLPDINMIEPLSEALEIGIADIITGKKDVEKTKEEEEKIEKYLKESLEYSQIKIKNAIRLCVPVVIFNWIILVIGTCVAFYYVDLLWLKLGLWSLVILATSFSMRVLKELLSQNN